MEELNTVYKILKYLQKSLKYEEFNQDGISPERLHIPRNEWEQPLITLQDKGYIKGIIYEQTLDSYAPEVEEPIQPVITLDGLEYLNENSTMKKITRTAKGTKEFVPEM